MLKGGAKFQRQKVLNRVAGNWNKEFLRTMDKGDDDDVFYLFFQKQKIALRHIPLWVLSTKE
jgi:RNA binding exosome subunit